MKIAIYSRKSKFTGKGESVENQIDMCKEYANKHFQKIDEFLIYEDEGFSGGNIDRPEFKRMMKDVKKKRFDVLMCYRLDRVSRNVSDFSAMIDNLQEYGIDFVCIREQFDTSTPMGRAMMYIASVFAQLERETIAERIKDNMHQLARTGRWLGGKTPMGFESKPIEYYDENMHKKTMFMLSPIKEELKTVKFLYEQYIKLNSLSRLEGLAFKKNIKTKTGKNFDVSTLKFILTNPVYCIADKLAYEYFEKAGSDIASPEKDFNGKNGLMVFNKRDIRKNRVNKKDESEWIVAVGKHKGIIPSSQWIEVQQMLKANSHKAPRMGTGKHGLLAGVIRCKCGSTMKVAISNKPYGTYYYYKCLLKERSRKTKCDNKNLNGSMADSIVIEKLKLMAMDNSSLMKTLDKRKNDVSAISSSASIKKKELQDKLTDYEKSIKNLTMQLAQNESSIAAKYIIEQIEELDNNIKEVKKELLSLEEKTEVSLLEQNNIDIIRSLIKNFAENVDSLEPIEQRNLIRRIVKQVTWNGETLEIDMFGQDNINLVL